MNNPVKNIVLHPGEFYFASKGELIHTLLGSCVSITLWHPEKRIGGMCHYILPLNPGVSANYSELDCRYADDVMKRFRYEVTRYGTQIKDYQAKVFGGGNMIRKVDQNTENSIGTRNSAAAMQLLIQENVNILVLEVGEFGHRRIKFDSSTGEVWVRYIESVYARTLA